MTTRKKEIFKASAEYCNTTDPLMTKSGEYSFIRGAKWADENPNWIKTEDELPPEGIEVIAFHHKWVDDEFTSAYWWDYQDCYETINKSNCKANEDFYRSHIDNTEPEYWCYIPKPPKE